MPLPTTFPEAYRRYMAAFGVPDLPDIAAVGVKFVKRGEAPPPEAQPMEMAYTWCYAVKQASKGEVPLVTKDTVGCVMAAIALGLVDEDDPTPLPGFRQYSQKMDTQPAPADFKAGRVYGCKAAARMDFAVYGADDPGRFQSVEAAQKAYAAMPKIQPANMDAVVPFPPDEDLAHLVPDVVILALTPRETARSLQGLAFETGDRFHFDTLGVGGFSVDLTAAPYLTGRPNASFMCVGARVIARWDGNLNGLGLPWADFCRMVVGLELSQAGFPFSRYPA